MSHIETQGLSIQELGSVLSALNGHLQGALVAMDECAMRLHLLEKVLRTNEINGWGNEALGEARQSEAMANITRHFLGKPF